jgi:hypothetical protein
VRDELRHTSVNTYLTAGVRRGTATSNFYETRTTPLPTFEERCSPFHDRYNQIAAPFDWRYSRKDLNGYLTLAAHENQAA